MIWIECQWKVCALLTSWGRGGGPTWVSPWVFLEPYIAGTDGT